MTTAEAGPSTTRGRLPRLGGSERRVSCLSAGVMVTCMHSNEERPSNTGSPVAWSSVKANRQPARNRPSVVGWRRGPYDLGSRVMPMEERGLSSRQRKRQQRAGDWETQSLQKAFRSYRRRYMRKRRQIRPSAFTRCTTSSIDRTYWRTPTSAAVPSKGERVWTGKRSSRWRVTGGSGGLGGWRTHSER